MIKKMLIIYDDDDDMMMIYDVLIFRLWVLVWQVNWERQMRMRN